MHTAKPWITLALTLALAAGCSDPAPASDAAVDRAATDASTDASTDGQSADAGPRSECNPLGAPEACLLPFPSAYYQGDTVQLPPAAMPVSLGRLSHGGTPAPLDPAPWNRLDGFSPTMPLLAYFAERIDPATLVPPTAIERSVTAMASTAIVDMETGERVAHFSEVDATVMPGEPQVVILRPTQRLKPAHRYAVAITRAVRTMAGAMPTVPAGFQAILDNAPNRDPRLARVASRYTDIFAALGRAGIQRTDLLLAWDYSTASERYLTGPVVAMRDIAMTMVGERGAGVNVTLVEDNYNATILRRVTGTFQVPQFLTATDADDGRIARNPDGTPRVVRMNNVPFVAMIPRSAMTRGPLPLLQFGHGLLGSAAGELGTAAQPTNYMQRFLNDYGFIAVATDWTGLSSGDTTTAGLALSDFNYLPTLTDRLQQALVNAMVLFRTARGQFAGIDAFSVGGTRVLDTTRAYYYGISLGGIMGTSFLGYSPDCDRGVVNVAGGNWSMLLQRSSNFGGFEFAFRDYTDRVERQVLLSLSQTLFDTSDPINVAPHLFRDRLPGTPEKRVLYQYAVDDAAVHNLASDSVVRSMGTLPLMLPSARQPFGIPTTMMPADSALSIWDEHPMPRPPGTNQPAMVNNTHGSIRDLMALKEQIRRFLAPMGRVEHTCDGPCDPQ